MFALLIAALARPSRLFAAEPTPSVHGQVVDRSGAVIVGATVSLIDPQHRRERRTATDARGQFAFADVAPGAHTLLVTAAGFTVVSDVVDPRSDVRVLLTLDPAPVTELITVRADAAETQTVSTATRLSSSLFDVPQTVDVIAEPLLKAQAAVSMADALRNVTGVSPNLGEGRRDQFLIRGFAATSDMLVDGVRDDALYYRDLSTLERVEVLKGPGAALFGRGSSGGVINRVTKRARLDRTVADFSLLLGTFDTRRATFDFGRPWNEGAAAYRVAGAVEDSGSYRDYARVSRLAVAPSMTLAISRTSTASAQAEFLHDRRVPDRGIPSVDGTPAAVRISQYYGTPGDDFLANDVLSGTVTADHRFASGWLVRTLARAARYDTRWSNTQPTGVVRKGRDVFVRRSQYNASQWQRNLFIQTEAVAGFTRGGIGHLLLAGLEVGSQRRDVTRFDGTAPDVTLIEPVLTPPAYATAAGTNNRFTGGIVGVYAQDQLSLGERWKALVGIRGDRYAQQLDDRLPKNVDLVRTDRTWSPRAGIVFQPRPRVSLYGTVSRSFQPSGESLSLAVNAAELDPERSRNVEGGVKTLLFRGRLSATASVFRLDRSNIKTTDPIDSTRLVLVGRQRTSGVELSLDGSIAPRVSLHAGYSWMAASILRSNSVLSGVRVEGNRPGFVPEHGATLWTTVAVTRALTLGGGMSASSSRFTSNDNLVVLRAYARVDAAASYRFGRCELSLNLRNVANARYYESASSNFQIYPGSPRSGVATVRVGF